ncbi:MAG: ATP-binding protein [Pseudomonadota bacterium]
MKAMKLRENFEGRIRNLSLSPSKAGNSLVPLFEGISNAVHAIAQRFGAEALTAGRIKVLIEKTDTPESCSMVVSDNGIGLNDGQFEAFLTMDTTAKARIGGKGVGRLTWLKVFENVSVVSRFQDSSGVKKRSFSFVVDENAPIQNHELTPAKEQVGTEIRLNHMRPEYLAHYPSKHDTVAKKIVAHFFPDLFSSQLPSIEVVQGDERAFLNELIHEKIHRIRQSIFEFEGHRIEIEHSLVDKAVADQFDQHTLLFSAHGRIVEEHQLDNQIGIANYISFDEISTRYIGVVKSEFLDNNSAQERNRFDIDGKLFKEFQAMCVEHVKGYLAEEIELVVNRQKEKLDLVVSNFPRYSYLVGDKDEFVRENLPLNANNEENIFRQLAVLDFRASRDVANKISEATLESATIEEPLSKLDAESKTLVSRLQAQERSALLDYVAKRKLILDLLSKYQGYDDEGDRSNYLEMAVHKVICPTKVTKNDINIFDHNLWVLDDRLTFYDFWASDKEIRTFVAESESKDRPDIILFQGGALFQRLGAAQPVVIVEFKRPARTGYSDDENPITQLYTYMRELRGKTVRDKTGALITSVDRQTPFFCYVVADITANLQQHLENQQVNKPLPGGRGFFGYHPEFNAYIEVIQYGKLIEDARIRNEAFFRKLGIN